MQFPAGTVEPGETAEAAALRELREETGLALPRPAFIGKFIFYKNYSREYQRRHVFRFDAPPDAPSSWSRVVKPDVPHPDSDGGLVLDLEWQPLDHLAPAILLIEGMADALERLRRTP